MKVKILWLMALFLFKSVFTFYSCLNSAFKFCPQNQNERLFSVMYSTSQSSVNDIFWCLGFPEGKSDYSITKKTKREKIHPRSPKCVSFRACKKIRHTMSAISYKLSYCSLLIKNNMKIKHIGWVMCEKYSYHLFLFPINLSECKQWVCLQFWSKHSLILESLWPNQSWRWTKEFLNFVWLSGENSYFITMRNNQEWKQLQANL